MVLRLATWPLLLAIAFCAITPVWAQSRPLAPGILTVVPPDPQYEETFSGPLELVEIVTGLPELDWQPNFTAKSRTVFERSKLGILRRQVWNLEFAFKPLRMIHVDVPQPSGKMQRKLVWYMVYRVRYLGGDLAPDPLKDKWGHETFQAKPISQEGRFFFPQFILESHDYRKLYQDRIIPAAKRPIEKREVRGKTLLNTVEISKTPIPLSTKDSPKEVWGLVTWEDIDPRIDFLTIYVKGLTNAYKPVDLPGVFKRGDPPGAGRDILSKTLRLNFWRPGDAVLEHENEIYFGVPYSPETVRQLEILGAFGIEKRLDYSWEYR